MRGRRWVRLLVPGGEQGEAGEEWEGDLKLVEKESIQLGLGKAKAMPVDAIPPILVRQAEEVGTGDGERARGGGAAVGCISTSSTFGSFQGVV